MLSGLAWLTLEVKYLERALSFYTDHLDLPVIDRTATEAILGVGDSELRLRTPGPVPRGGLHTHYAFAIPRGEYDQWKARLGEQFDLDEHQFGSASSLYCYDPDGHCVELGQFAEEGSGITGIFEVVLEVESLDRALAVYTGLGGEVVDRGEARRRARLDLGPVDIELWEPQLGIADGRGGVHVDLGFRADDPTAVADAIAEDVCSVTYLDDGTAPPETVRIKDPDGHYLTIRRE
ncbi:MAG: VOC family protein [Halobacteriales archaeon]|nr:VOC family protein [Halobacteriales archaeon]